MTDEPAIPIDEAQAVAWLRRQRAALDPTRRLLIRGPSGRVVAVLPRNGREVEDDPAADETP